MARAPSWLVQVVSLVLILLGLGPLSAGLLFLSIGGPGLDALQLLPFALVFLGGIGLFVWDRRRLRPELGSNRAAARLYSRMTAACLVLLAASLAAYLLWPANAPRGALAYPLSAILTAGLWGSVFSGWAWYRAGSPRT